MRAFGGNDAAAAAEQRFGDWTSTIERALAPGERYTATCAGEATDFARMNRGKVRQAGSVLQNELSIRLVRGARHAEHTLAMTGDAPVDREAIADAVEGLRDVLPDLADDPHLLLADRVESRRVERAGALPPAVLLGTSCQPMFAGPVTVLPSRLAMPDFCVTIS